MKKRRTFAVLHIRWIDSRTIVSRWTEEERIKEASKDGGPLLESVGFLLSEDRKHIALAMDFDPDGGLWNMVSSIPKCAIVSRKTLAKITCEIDDAG